MFSKLARIAFAAAIAAAVTACAGDAANSNG